MPVNRSASRDSSACSAVARASAVRRRPNEVCRAASEKVSPVAIVSRDRRRTAADRVAADQARRRPVPLQQQRQRPPVALDGTRKRMRWQMA